MQPLSHEVVMSGLDKGLNQTGSNAVSHGVPSSLASFSAAGCDIGPE